MVTKLKKMHYRTKKLNETRANERARSEQIKRTMCVLTEARGKQFFRKYTERACVKKRRVHIGLDIVYT